MKKRMARWLRTVADRIDHHGAPKATGWTFTFEHNEGMQLREDGKGCRLWYYGDDDYDKAHSQADTEHIRVNWSTMTATQVGGR